MQGLYLSAFSHEVFKMLIFFIALLNVLEYEQMKLCIFYRVRLVGPMTGAFVVLQSTTTGRHGAIREIQCWILYNFIPAPFYTSWDFKKKLEWPWAIFSIYKMSQDGHTRICLHNHSRIFLSCDLWYRYRQVYVRNPWLWVVYFKKEIYFYIIFYKIGLWKEKEFEVAAVRVVRRLLN